MNVLIKKKELSLAIRKTKTGRESGLDMILIELYKIWRGKYSPYLIYTQSGDHPQVWANGNINPIYKIGKWSDQEY